MNTEYSNLNYMEFAPNKFAYSMYNSYIMYKILTNNTIGISQLDRLVLFSLPSIKAEA